MTDLFVSNREIRVEFSEVLAPDFSTGIRLRLINALISVISRRQIAENSATIKHLDQPEIDGTKLAIQRPAIANFAPLIAPRDDLGAGLHGPWPIQPPASRPARP
jgi:hypothetical protein